MMRLFSIVFVLLGARQAYAFQCYNVFSLSDDIAIFEQIELVKSYEQKSLKKDSDTIVTDYQFLYKILSVYGSTTAQVSTGMSAYSATTANLSQAFPQYLEFRFKLLSKSEKAGVQKVIDSVMWSNSKTLGIDGPKDVTAAYAPTLRKIVFEMPPHYKGTLVHAFLFAHEMEHAIQHTRLLNSFTDHSQDVSDRASQEIDYLSELGAMNAEWVFLQGISDDEIKATILQIKQSKDIEASYKKFFLRAFKNSRLPLGEYLEQEHLAGRYSHASIVH